MQARKNSPSPTRATIALVFSVILFLSASVAVAAEPSRPSRPLDVDACFKDPSLDVPPCDYRWFPSREGATGQMALLYGLAKWQLLDRALTRSAFSDTRFDDGYSYAYAAQLAFARIMGARAEPGEYERVLETWRAQVPGSVVLPIAHANLVYNSAWRIRGSGYANTVSPESWELFDQKLSAAEEILLAAPAETRDTPVWHQLLLLISLDRPGRDNANAIFSEAVRRWPGYYSFYHTMSYRLTPRWGHSFETLDAFITEASQRLAATDGDSVYARLYAAVHRAGYQPSETRVDWGRMKKSFEALITRYPAGMFKSRYASHACFFRDKEAFRAAIKGLLQWQNKEDDWLRGYSYEACMRWAGITPPPW